MVSTILPCWITTQETLNLTQLTIESLPESELVIIDNASTMASGYLRSVADVYMKLDKNYGYTKAVNEGIKHSKHDLLCVSNNDVRVPDNIFKVATKIFRKNKRVGSVHFNEISYAEPFNFQNKTWITGKERWCTSSFFVIKRKAIPNGGYDEKFDGRGSYDDYDFWHRVRHVNGWKTAYTLKSAYQHWGSHSFVTRGMEQRRAFDEINRQYFIKKWGNNPDTMFMDKYPEQWNQDYALGFLE